MVLGVMEPGLEHASAASARFSYSSLWGCHARVRGSYGALFDWLTECGTCAVGTISCANAKARLRLTVTKPVVELVRRLY
jgi:hypothetical protein